jgi:hypothetical protein
MRAARCVAALVGAVALVVGSAPVASADRPLRTTEPLVGDTFVRDLCPFRVRVQAEGTVVTVEHTRDGVPTHTLVHAVETDTFSANGVTLVGETYRPQFRLVYGRTGELEHVYSSGVLTRVRLPDGRTFMAAGRFDFLTRTEDFVVTPDSGTVRNLDAFCDALGG